MKNKNLEKAFLASLGVLCSSVSNNINATADANKVDRIKTLMDNRPATQLCLKKVIVKGKTSSDTAKKKKKISDIIDFFRN